MDKKFCRNLKSARKNMYLTQKQVADHLQVISSCYSNWEQGRTEPSIAMLRRLGGILNISLEDLINGDI